MITNILEQIANFYMTFHNKEIVVDTWDVDYVEDPFYIFLKITLYQQARKKTKLLIPFHGSLQTSMAMLKKIQVSTPLMVDQLAKKDRLSRIQKIQDEFSDQLARKNWHL